VREVNRWLVVITLAVAAFACGPAQKPATKTATGQPARVQSGMASWYGGELHGSRTASGERFNKNALTAAHRTLPLGTRVRVTNTRNGKSVIVRINDRGPFGRRKRIIDVSEAAARRLGMIDAGIVPVRIEVVK
jgi:rare lipoprotein A